MVQNSAVEPQDTPVEQIDQIYADLRQSFRSRVLLPLEARKRALAQLAHMIQDNGDAIIEAAFTDLHRPRRDTLLGEVNGCVGWCLNAIANLEKWNEDGRVDATGKLWEHWDTKTIKSAKGPILIIGPYNYPFFLTLTILGGAIAAGCPAAVKFSDLAPACGAVMQEAFPKYLDPKICKLIIGGVPQTTALLDKKWGHIFYTGNGVVGRIIAAAAAKHLTPCTLELGGKSPVIIDPTFDMKLAAKRILFGKTSNAGQICVSPDYILIPEEGKAALIEGFKEAYAEFFPQGAQASDSYGRMLNKRHFKRVENVLRNSKGKVVVGGHTDEAEKFIEPTIVSDVQSDDSLMEDEIFGPVLAIVTVKNIDEAIEYVNDRDEPLQLCLFSTNPEIKKKVQDHTLSGSIIFNDTLYNIVVNDLPFGGVGASGYGYHFSKYTFDNFVHLRASLDMPVEAEPFLAVRYAPYTVEKTNIVTTGLPLKIPFSKEIRDTGVSL